jgi:hypothetical protein
MWTSEISDKAARRMNPDPFGEQSQKPDDSVNKE